MDAHQRLWQQVLFRTLCDALGFTNTPKHTKEHTDAVAEARHWFYDCPDDIELVAQFSGLDPERVRKAGIQLIEAQQSGDHSRVPEFWRDAFRRNRMPSFTAYRDQIDKLIGKL